MEPEAETLKEMAMRINLIALQGSRNRCKRKWLRRGTGALVQPHATSLQPTENEKGGAKRTSQNRQLHPNPLPMLNKS